jgi:hypothetical protein
VDRPHACKRGPCHPIPVDRSRGESGPQSRDQSVSDSNSAAATRRAGAIGGGRDKGYFNLYRVDSLPPADAFSCLRDRIVALEAIDDGALPKSGLLQYLVTAVACGGEPTAGATSAGKERRAKPCP